MMSARYYDIALAVIGLCICSGLTEALERWAHCESKLCPGPLYYYEELGCTPVFEDSTPCCPTRYDCDNWKKLPQDKCLVNGRVYENDEALLPELASDEPCLTFYCKGDSFVVMENMYTLCPVTERTCYYVTKTRRCGEIIRVCASNPVTCVVDGKPYKIGEPFIPSGESKKTCYCDKGYDGVNDERFCNLRKPSWCMNVIRNISSIRANCAPIYASDSLLNEDCNVGMRCHKIDEDHVIKKQTDNHEQSTLSTREFDDPDKQCILGNLTMNIGEELNEVEDHRGFSSCICEVPPVPTCRYIQK